MMKSIVLLLAGLTAGSLAWAQTVALAGMMGGKALLIVDGSPPKSVAIGQTFRGVKVVSTQGDEAVLEIAGERHNVRVGDSPAHVGAPSAASGGANKVVLNVGQGGHFIAQGQINGKTIQLLVDTGATLVSLSVADAERVGLNYRSGEPVQMSTANGVVPGWRLRLDTVRLGGVTVHDVEAIVSSGSMPFVLLGNSFLNRFQMTRTNDQMILEKRY